MTGRTRHLAGAGLLAFAVVLLPGAAAQASPLHTLYAFCALVDCVDGSTPDAALLQDASGNLYGTTQAGGAHGLGTVFELEWMPQTARWRYKVLYHLCALSGCPDGVGPLRSRLIMDESGALYGTANGGGTAQEGIVFKLTPNARRSRWSLSAIWNFCSRFTSCSDGASPVGGLTYLGAESGAPYDGRSPLYGVTLSGGRHFQGIAYSLEPKPNGGWSEKVLYGFCRESGCVDGALPQAELLLDAAGKLYGTTQRGGANGKGLVFRLSPSTGTKLWDETTLHSFCSVSGCADGNLPNGGLVMDAAGNLFGTTQLGGLAPCNLSEDGCGVAFELTPDGSETVLHTFCSAGCADGAEPFAGLVLDGAGNLYGTTYLGTAGGGGGVFRLNGEFKVLYSFPACGFGCEHGDNPVGGLILDSTGDLFGSNTNRGKNDEGGTIFELTPRQGHQDSDGRHAR